MAEEHTCACGGSCGCGGGGNHHHHEEQSLTREQYISRLEEYLLDLRNEISAVERELNELRRIPA